MDRQQADAFVGELAAALGIPDLALDEHGSATLGIGEEQVIVSFGYNTAAGTIDLMACLDEIVPTTTQLAAMLDANFGWLALQGAAFATVPGTGEVVLQRRCTAEQLLAGGLAPRVEALADLVPIWTERLRQAAAAPADTIEPLNLSDSGILRV